MLSQWVFTVGLSLGAAVDIFIAAGLCYFLRRGRTGFSRFDYMQHRVVSSLTFIII